MATKPTKQAAHTSAQVVRTAAGQYVISRSLADPDMKPAIDAYQKKVTSSRKAAQQFLKDVGVLTEAGNLARSYGG